MLKKKLFSLLLIPVLSLSMLAGCGKPAADSAKKEGEKVTLKLWHLYPERNEPDTQHAIIKKMAAEFEKKNPNVKVEVLGNQSADKVLTAITSGQGPDVFLNLWPNISTWSDKGALLDLTDLTKDADFDAEDILKGAWERAIYKGKKYGVPYNAVSSELFYNKDMLKEAGYDKAPKTIEELIEMNDKITKKDAKGNLTQLGFLPDYPWLDNVLWPVSFGADWIDEKTNKITFDTPEMRAAYQWQADIYKKYGADNLQKYKSGFGDDAQNPFVSGKLAMTFFPEEMIHLIQKYNPKLNYGVATIPYPKNKPELKGSMFITSTVWNISSKTKNKDESWKLLKFIASKDTMQNIWMADTKGTSGLLSRKSVLNNLPDTTPKELKEVAKMLQGDNVKGFPMLSYINEYLTIINDEMQLTLTGKQTVEEATKKVQDKVQPIADKNPINK